MNPKTPTLLDDLASGTIDLHEIARLRGYTRRQMAEWIGRPRAAATLDALAHLAERRAELLLATGRAEAARALVALATGPASEAREMARKACVDLIKLGTAEPRAAATPASASAPTSREALEAEARAAFDVLAEIAREREAGAIGAD